MSASRDREEFVCAVENEDSQPFLNLMARHTQKNDAFHVGELLAILERRQLEEVWSQLQSKATAAMLSLELADDQGHELADLGRLLEMVVLVAMETLKIDDIVPPASLYNTAVLLHGIVWSVGGDMPRLSSSISQLCEAWWSAGLDGRDDLAPQTLLYLLDNSLQPKATKADVKRVWKMHECLASIDLSNQSSDSLKLRLQHAAIAPLYLKSQEGTKFLAYILQLEENIIDSMHSTMKNTLHTINRTTAEAYGSVYFKAWRNAAGNIQQKLETACIQDLMFLAVHVESRVVSSNLRQLLGYFHKQKKQTGVDEMLKRLYDPIIWRSLKVTNADVRADALLLLVDAFPIQDPSASVQDIDHIRQRQFDILDELMFDASAHVRGLAAQGICRICNVYWEMLPPGTIKAFLSRLTTDLVWDGSSADVRYAVIKGLTHLLDNHLAHPLMKSVLPELRNLLHDHSEKVRVAFCDLLLKVKGISSIKYYHIAPVEHLLARLEIDSDCISRRLVKLLHNSYIPTDKNNDELFFRTVTLVRDNPMAARKFYQVAAKNCLPVADTARLMVLICRAVLKCVRDETSRAHAPAAHMSGSRPDSGFVSADILESSEEEEDTVGDSGVQGDARQIQKPDSDEDDEDAVSVRDTELMLGLLDTVVILWTVIEPALVKESNEDIRTRLEQRFGVALPEYLRVFHQPHIVSTLILLAGFLPPSAVPMLSRSMVSKLRGMTSQNNESDYAAMLHAMCHWNKADHVLELVSDWLKTGLNVEDSDSNSSKRASGRRAVMFQENVEPQPELALTLLAYMLKIEKCRSSVLEAPSIHVILKHLRNVMKCIEKRLGGEENMGLHTNDNFLLQAFELYLKLEILLHDSTNKTNNAVVALENLITWCDAEILFLFRKNAAAKSKRKGRKLLGTSDATLLADATTTHAQTALGQTTLGGATLSQTLLSETIVGKRTLGDSNMAAACELGVSVLESMLAVAADVMLIGLADRQLAAHFAHFSFQILQLEESARFLPAVSKLVYQVAELSLYSEEQEGEEALEGQGDLVPSMLTKLIAVLASLVNSNKEQAERILPSIKTAVAEMLYSYHKHLSIHCTLNQHIIHTILTATVNELYSLLKKDSTFEACDSLADLPPLSAFFLNILFRKKDLASMYVNEMRQEVEALSPQDIYKMAAYLHILLPLTTDKKCVGDVKECAHALQRVCEEVQLPAEESQDSPLCHLSQQNSVTLKDCMTRLGIVA